MSDVRDLTLADHLTLVDATWGRDAHTCAERVHEALTTFGLDTLGERFPHELSSGQGQLFRLALTWFRPARLLVPAGFLLLVLQGASELIKRIAFLQGLIEDPTVKKVEKTAEEELAESIRNLAEAAKGNGKNKAEAH